MVTLYGSKLIRERLDNKRACRIKTETTGIVYDEEMWPEMIKFMVSALVSLETAFSKPITNLNTKIKSINKS